MQSNDPVNPDARGGVVHSIGLTARAGYWER
jgi:hypothetical protein